MPHRRTHSVDSEATISGDSDPLIQKSRASVDSEYTCEQNYTGCGSCKRRRRFRSLLLFGLPSLVV